MIRKIANSAGILLILVQVGVCATLSQARADNIGTTEFHRFWPDNLFAIEFVNDRIGFIAGYSGTVLRTDDGGESWDFTYIGRNELIRRVSFVDETTGWAVGHRGTIFHTGDGGKSWQIQKELPGVYLRDIDFADRLHGWAVGHDANIWHTEDGGQNWNQQTLLGFKGRDAPRLHGIYAKSADTAILVGEFGVVGHTENGGGFWLTTPVETKTTLLSVSGIAETIYAVGLEGEIVRLSAATPEEREKINRRVAAQEAEEEARARKKAQRLKRQYVKQDKEVLPASETEYVAEIIPSGVTEHLFDVAITSNADAIVVGRSTVLKISGSSVTALDAEKEFPLPFIWLGGVAVTPSGKFWAAGIRGLVAAGDIEKMNFGQAFNLGRPNQVKLVSSRWGSNP